jgi:hypothetical protein
MNSGKMDVFYLADCMKIEICDRIISSICTGMRSQISCFPLVIGSDCTNR